MSATDIFLSYARTDRAAARMFADAFAEEGFRVWWDASLHSGETFDEVIEQRLRDAKAVVVLWSPRSVASRWVRAEATQADRKNKLAPAIIEACDRPIIFELTHAADLCDWHGDTTDIHWRTFVDDLRRLVDAAADEPAKHHAAPPSPGQPVTRQPIRPGHDDIIHADRNPAQRVQPLHQPHAAAINDVPADDPNREVHCLELEDGELGEELFVVEASGAKLGRTPPADIVIAHQSVSRQHCIIGLANDELFVTDLNSTNGTYIDGERIQRATVLPVGSVVKVGEVALKHSIHSSAEAQRRLAASGAGLPQGRLAARS